MEINKSSRTFLEALRDFRRVRQKAILEDIMAQITGKSDDLLDYNEVYEKLKGSQPEERGLQEIPLDAVVGSVGRYADFTRSFLPRSKSASERWAEVKASIIEKGYIPPISVYQIDQVYFVLDGNHRVSVARQRGDTHIPAHVTEIHTDVPLEPDTQPDDLIIKARYAIFLQHTQLHEVRPEAHLDVTAPGPYHILEEQIKREQRQLRERSGQEVSMEEAAGRWYDEVYMPVIQIIRRRGILRHFPQRTETDLYVWIYRHQAELKAELGWEVGPQIAADDLVTQFSSKPDRVLTRVTEKLRDAITPEPLEAGPPPGQWRKEWLPAHDDRLFVDILVAVAGSKANWAAVSQALVVARREQGRLHGLHVVPSEAEAENRKNRDIRAEFEARCRQGNVPGELTFETGRVVRAICNRARWSDLVVIHFSHLPRPRPDDRLVSGLGAVIRRCPRPVLAIPDRPSPLERALLAYDGSPKAKEALFVAAYLAGKWQTPLVVVTVVEGSHATPATLVQAQKYLEGRGVEAIFVQEEGNVGQAIIRTAQLYDSDFMIMGGYGFNPVVEVMLGSEVDLILRTKQWPVLICR